MTDVEFIATSRESHVSANSKVTLLSELVSPREKKAFLHYVGKEYYSGTKFAAEAKEKGVSRAIPFSMLKSMEWQDQIFLAQFSADGRFRQQGYGFASIFGYFSVSGFNHDLPTEFMQEVAPFLRLDCSAPSTPMQVDRECGSYGISAICTTTATLQEVTSIIEELAKKNNIDLSKHKFFVTGYFHDLDEKKIPLYFFRGYSEIEKMGEVQDTDTGESHFILQLHDYRKSKRGGA